MSWFVPSSDFTPLVENLLAEGLPVIFEARGTSMSPEIRHGDRVAVRPLRQGEPRMGQVVLASREEGLVLHRLVGCTREGELLTAGDRLRYLDPPWRPEQVLGVAICVERHGRRRRLGRRADLILKASLRRAAGRILRALDHSDLELPGRQAR